MLWCFVYLKQPSLLPKTVFPFHFHWRPLSGPASHGCSCDFACFIIWNWNYNCKVRGNLLSNWYVLRGRVGMMSMTDMQMTFLKHLAHLKTTEKRGVDWYGAGCRTPSLHEPVDCRHCYIQHGQTFALHMEDVLTKRSAGCTQCGNEDFALWTSSALFTQPVCMSCFLP